MTKLEELQEIRKGTKILADQCEEHINESYKNLILAAARNNNFPEDKIRGIYLDVAMETPYQAKDRYSRDYIRIDVGDETNYHDLTIYVKADKMTINNCCSGDWEINSWYYWYAKLMVIIADIGTQLQNLCAQFDRKPIHDDFLAQCDVSWEQERIKKEEEQLKREKLISELNGAEYIAHYRTLRYYEPGFQAGADNLVIESLYKVVKRTEKNFIVNQLYKEYRDGELTNTWSLRYKEDTRIKKEVLYWLGNNYRAINKNDLDIREN